MKKFSHGPGELRLWERSHCLLDLPRAFRCPGVPVLPILAVAACLFLMLNLQAVTWIAFAVWLTIGLAIYFSYGVRHSRITAVE